MALPPARQRTRRVLDLGHQEGSIEVRRTRYGSEPETIYAQRIHVPTFPTQPAFVSVRTKESINMGDFNNVSVEVSVSLPCLPEASELDRVYTMASDTCERWLEREIRRATNADWENPPNE